MTMNSRTHITLSIVLRTILCLGTAAGWVYSAAANDASQENVYQEQDVKLEESHQGPRNSTRPRDLSYSFVANGILVTWSQPTDSSNVKDYVISTKGFGFVWTGRGRRGQHVLSH